MTRCATYIVSVCDINGCEGCDMLMLLRQRCVTSMVSTGVWHLWHTRGTTVVSCRPPSGTCCHWCRPCCHTHTSHVVNVTVILSQWFHSLMSLVLSTSLSIVSLLSMSPPAMSLSNVTMSPCHQCDRHQCDRHQCDRHQCDCHQSKFHPRVSLCTNKPDSDRGQKHPLKYAIEYFFPPACTKHLKGQSGANVCLSVLWVSTFPSRGRQPNSGSIWTRVPCREDAVQGPRFPWQCHKDTLLDKDCQCPLACFLGGTSPFTLPLSLTSEIWIQNL